MHRNARLAGLLLALAIAPGAAFAAPTDPVDPIEHELLVRMVRVGLTRDRSDKPEHAAQLVCVRDRYPGSRRVRLRCATNQDWDAMAALSLARSEGASTDKKHAQFGNSAAIRSEQSWLLKGSDVKDGVLDVSPNLMTDPAGKDDSPEANLARIHELRAMHAVDKMPDAANTPAQDVVRFARAFDEVRRSGSDETRAANAVTASGLSVEVYNAFVTRLEQDQAFRARVDAALKSIEAPLTL